MAFSSLRSHLDICAMWQKYGAFLYFRHATEIVFTQNLG